MDGSNLSANEIMLEIILIIVGIYMFYRSISSFMVQWYLKNKSRKYKKDNMFLYRNLTSKINTMSITMATIAFMFTIILIGGNVALLLNDLLSNEIEMEYPFEVMISSSEPDFSLYKDYIEKNARVREIFRDYIQRNPVINIANKDFTIKEVRSENLAQVSFNGYTYCIVQTEEQTSEKFYDDLRDLVRTEERKVVSEYNGEKQEYSVEYSLADVRTRGKRSNETKSFFTIISFLAFYVALIFVMATATLLAVQQLSDSEKYKYRYELLKKLGVDEEEVNL